jgi:hypothetical protein
MLKLGATQDLGDRLSRLYAPSQASIRGTSARCLQIFPAQPSASLEFSIRNIVVRAYRLGAFSEKFFGHASFEVEGQGKENSHWCQLLK